MVFALSCERDSGKRKWLARATFSHKRRSGAPDVSKLFPKCRGDWTKASLDLIDHGPVARSRIENDSRPARISRQNQFGTDMTTTEDIREASRLRESASADRQLHSERAFDLDRGITQRRFPVAV